MRKLTTLTCCILMAMSQLSLANTPEAAAPAPVGDAQAGKAKSVSCAACHDVEGKNPLMPIYPRLSGQHASYTVQQLMLFKEGGRVEPTMSPMAKPLSTQDMEDLAAYFASLPVKPGATKEEFVKLGEKIYRGGNLQTNVPACAACHSPNAAGNPEAKFPMLSGQSPEYIKKQLEDYKKGTRGGSAPTLNQVIMREIAQKMTAEEIQAVSNVASGLH
ncbi:MAG: c-type cytochrome [Thiotrichaceae bacterium]